MTEVHGVENYKGMRLRKVSRLGMPLRSQRKGTASFSVRGRLKDGWKEREARTDVGRASKASHIGSAQQDGGESVLGVNATRNCSRSNVESMGAAFENLSVKKGEEAARVAHP